MPWVVRKIYPQKRNMTLETASKFNRDRETIQKEIKNIR